MHKNLYRLSLTRLRDRTIASGTLLLALGGSVLAAQAACTGLGGVYTCSDMVTTPVTITGDDISVTTQPGFSMNVTGNDPALYIEGNGSVSFLDDNNSVIQAESDGIVVDNNIPGGDVLTDLTVSNITSVSGIGIVSSTSTHAGLATTLINAGTVVGDAGGISTDSYAFQGNTLTEITATKITAGVGVAINSTTSANIGSATNRINVETIDSEYDGIQASSNSVQGDARTDITASKIAVRTGIGISSHVSASEGAATTRINVGSIEGEYGGISINNVAQGGDALTDIVVSGTIRTGEGGGIGISSYSNAIEGNGEIYIAAQDIDMGCCGAAIQAYNSVSIGNNLTEISVAGTISAQDGHGIYAHSNVQEGNSTTRILARDIDVGYDGIIAHGHSYLGNSLIDIAVAGTVTLQGGYGIYTHSGSDYGNTAINISAGDIDADSGVFTEQHAYQGNGMTNIAVTGAVKAEYSGIASNSYVSEGNSDIHIAAKDIEINCCGYGIQTSNSSTFGNSLTDISVAGMITAEAGYGIYSNTFVHTGRFDMAIDVGSISSMGEALTVYGFAYDNAGARSTISVTTRDDIRSSEGSGIYVYSNDADSYLTVGGLVHGGSGYAIDMNREENAGRQATVELRPGYALEGATLATVDLYDGNGRQLDLANSHLVLGGSRAASFDLERIDNRAGAINTGGLDRVTGFGTLAKSGDSIWTLTGSNDADTADAFLSASIDVGILALDNASLKLATAGSVPQATEMLTIAAGALLSIGASTVDGHVANSGSIILSSQYAGGSGIATGDRLTINGDYIGNGGLVTIDTVLGDDSSATDKLIVEGDTSGVSYVKVFNAGGMGAQTVEGIRIIEVGGASDGNFALLSDYTTLDNKQAVKAGAYAYTLEKNGVSTPTDGDWYLRSTFKEEQEVSDGSEEPGGAGRPEKPRYSASTPVYEAYPQALLTLNGVSTLQQRVGNRVWAGKGNRVIAEGADAIGTPYEAPEEADIHTEGNGVWGRIEGAHNHIGSGHSTTGVDYDQNIFKLQAGIDGMLMENEGGRLIGGISVHYTHGLTRTASIYDAKAGGGRIDTDGYGLGGTLTWYGENGLYVDAQAQATWYNSDLSYAGGNQSLINSNDGFGYALSIEGGKRIALDPAWSLIPQAQLVYSSVDFDDFHDVDGIAVRLAKGESLQGRLGITLDHQTAWQNASGMLDRAHVYGIANLYYEFLEGTRVDVADVSFASRKDRLWGGAGLGGSYNWNDDKYSIYGEGLVNTSLNNLADSYSLRGNVGLRVKW